MPNRQFSASRTPAVYSPSSVLCSIDVPPVSESPGSAHHVAPNNGHKVLFKYKIIKQNHSHWRRKSYLFFFPRKQQLDHVQQPSHGNVCCLFSQHHLLTAPCTWALEPPGHEICEWPAGQQDWADSSAFQGSPALPILAICTTQTHTKLFHNLTDTTKREAIW